VTLRVAIDARELTGKPTGVGRYLRELLERWSTAPYAGGSECLLFSPAAPSDRPVLPSGPGTAIRWIHVAGTGGTWWEQGALASAISRAGADVLFSPSYSSPLRTRLPLVLAMHDVSFAAHPEWLPWRSALRMRVLARASARKATAIVTLSRFSAGEIQRHLRPAAPVHVIPLAVDYQSVQPWPDGTACTRDAHQILYVGSIFERRHLPLLLEGLARARRRDASLRLEIIGENRTRPRIDLEARAAALGLASAVRLRDYVSETALAEAYARSGVFAYLSAYEGFGLPPLEAMRAGLATVVLETPVAREVYRDGAMFVPAGDPDALAETLVRLATDATARDAQVARGQAVASTYRWETTATETWRVLTSAAGTR
jgi:glycosyltransferase involved in cell wall biosynthesis